MLYAMTPISVCYRQTATIALLHRAALTRNCLGLDGFSDLFVGFPCTSLHSTSVSAMCRFSTSGAHLFQHWFGSFLPLSFLSSFLSPCQSPFQSPEGLLGGGLLGGGLGEPLECWCSLRPLVTTLTGAGTADDCTPCNGAR